jgi:hypothetical protein
MEGASNTKQLKQLRPMAHVLEVIKQQPSNSCLSKADHVYACISVHLSDISQFLSQNM